MPTSLIVALIVGMAIVTSAVISMIATRRSNATTRRFVAVFFAPIALFCLYGFVAAGEPGDYHIVWRVGYGFVFISCLFTIGWLLFAKYSLANEKPEQTP